MANENKIYITEGELAEMLDISIGHNILVCAEESVLKELIYS